VTYESETDDLNIHNNYMIHCLEKNCLFLFQYSPREKRSEACCSLKDGKVKLDTPLSQCCKLNKSVFSLRIVSPLMFY